MGVFHFFKIVQMITNRATHPIYTYTCIQMYIYKHMCIYGTKYSRMDQVKLVEDWKLFKGCLPQISLGLFLSTLSLVLIKLKDEITQF